MDPKNGTDLEENREHDKVLEARRDLLRDVEAEVRHQLVEAGVAGEARKETSEDTAALTVCTAEGRRGSKQPGEASNTDSREHGQR